MKKSTSSKQLEILVKYLQNHYELIGGFAISSKANKRREQMWTQVAEELNLHGPPFRDYRRWKSVWADYKYNLKLKLSADLKLAKRNNCGKRLSFNKTEQTVINLLGLRDKVLNSKNREKKFKVHLEEPTVDDSSVYLYHVSRSDTETVDVKEGILINNEFDSSTTADVTDSEALPARQEYMETDVFDTSVSSKLTDTLMAMQKTQQAILEELKESNRHNKNAHDLKERRLQLEQDKLDQKKLQSYEVNRQTYIKIELKRKELELYEIKLKELCTQCSIKEESLTD